MDTIIVLIYIMIEIIVYSEIVPLYIIFNTKYMFKHFTK